MSRHLHFPNTQNARDLGGLPLADGGVTRSHAFVRAANLGTLTQAGLHALYDYGIHTIVDLRSADELLITPSNIPPGSRLIVQHRPFLGASTREWHTRAVNSKAARGYLGMLDKFQPEVLEIMSALADAPEGGVLFHCYAGKDRTGVTSMLLLSLAGVPDAAIAEDYSLSAEGLRAMRDEDVERATTPERMAAAIEEYQCPPEVMLQTLAHLHGTYGGAARYLNTIGLDPTRIKHLRARLRPE